MPAVAQEPNVAPYRKLLDYLGDKDGPVTVDSLPKEMTELRILASAWTAGLIEFGMRQYVVTGEPSPNNARAGTTTIHYKSATEQNADGTPATKVQVMEIPGSATRYILEQGISWTGVRKTWQKSLKDMLAEKLDVVAGANIYEQDKTGKLVKCKDTSALKLMVRITDHGHAALAY